MIDTRSPVRDGRTLVMRRPADHELAPARPSSYLHGLDGVRVMAVVLVVYHVDPSWLPGGFLGDLHA